MSILAASLLAATAAPLLLAPSGSNAQPAGTLYFSAETAFGPRTGGGDCSTDGTLEGPARDRADTLDDGWVVAAGRDEVVIGLFPLADAGSIGNDYVLNFPNTAITVEIAKYDITPTLAQSTAVDSVGVIDMAGGTDPQLSAPGSEQLQDCAPKPTSLVSTGEGGPLGAITPSWDPVGVSGDGTTLDSVLFTFSEPVSDFGAWFGDLETRAEDATGPDDGGELGWVKLYAADGRVLAVEPINPNVQVPVTADGVLPGGVGFDNDGFGCGDRDVGTDVEGCGNHGTRYLGFNWSSASVAAMQVIVGDDDHCSISACDGLAESLSFIGPQLALENPVLLLEKVVINDNGGSAMPSDAVIELVTDPNGLATVSTHQSGQVLELSPGVSYLLREVVPAGYTQASLVCLDLVTGLVQPEVFTSTGLGQRIQCTITNDDVVGSTTTTIDTASASQLPVTGSGRTGLWLVAAVGLLSTGTALLTRPRPPRIGDSPV